MSLGQALAEARRDAGLSLDDVAGATRIRRTIVAAIEDDDFRLCGGEFYAKAHIRSIARVVRADPMPLLSAFGTGHPPIATDHSPLDSFRGERRRRGPNWSAAMAAVLVLVLSFGLYRVISSTDAPRRPQVAAGGTLHPSTTVPARTSHSPKPTSQRPASSALAQIPRTGVNVRLAAPGGASWVSVTNGSGKQLFQGIVAQGATRSFTDPTKVRLVLGNAGAVLLVVNGKPVGAPGKSGSVARVEFVPGDPATG